MAEVVMIDLVSGVMEEEEDFFSKKGRLMEREWKCHNFLPHYW